MVKDTIKQAMAAVKTRIPGYWTTGELCRLLGVKPAAIGMQVCRGRLAPIDRSRGQQSVFTEAEVYRYLSEPQTGAGRRRTLPGGCRQPGG